MGAALVGAVVSRVRLLTQPQPLGIARRRAVPLTPAESDTGRVPDERPAHRPGNTGRLCSASCDHDVAARLTSKGQVTIPKAVREALGLRDGDEVVFGVEGMRAVLARTSDLLDLAGSVGVPAAKRGASWDEVRRLTRTTRTAARR